jgi:hypothetical protein
VGLCNDEGPPASLLRVSGHCSQPACYRMVMVQVDIPWHLMTRRGINGCLEILKFLLTSATLFYLSCVCVSRVCVSVSVNLFSFLITYET